MPRPPGQASTLGNLYGDHYERYKLPHGGQLWWGGNAIRMRMQRAVEDALDEVALQCVADAHPNTPFRYGYARGSLGKGWPNGERYKNTDSPPSGALPPTWDGTGPRKGMGNTYILWGSAGVHYYMILEIGTASRPAHNMIRNAADKYYPTLTATIAKHYKNPIP